MGRKKKKGFREMKMLASRVEKADYEKFEAKFRRTGKSLQEVLNAFIVGYISGSVYVEGKQLVGSKEDDHE
jgi:hypothetical protein